MGERTPVALLDAASVGARSPSPKRSPNIRRRRRRPRSATSSCRANWMAAGGPARRGRRALRRGARRRRWSSARRSGIAIPVGKDSLSMTHGVGRRRPAKSRGRAAVADRDRVRAGDGDVRKHAGRRSLRTERRRRRCSAAGRSRRAARTASAARRSRRCTAQLGGDAAGSRRSAAARRSSRPRSRSCARRAWCWPITIAPTAALFATLARDGVRGPLRPRRQSYAGVACNRRSRRAVLAKSSAWCCR